MGLKGNDDPSFCYLSYGSKGCLNFCGVMTVVVKELDLFVPFDLKPSVNTGEIL